MHAKLLSLFISSSLVWFFHACGSAQDSPEAVAEAFVKACQQNDGEAMFALLESQTVTKLVQAAQQASDQLGGRRFVAPHEMLHIHLRDPLFELAEVKSLHQDEHSAQVEIKDTQQKSYTFTLVLEDWKWKLQIPSP